MRQDFVPMSSIFHSISLELTEFFCMQTFGQLLIKEAHDMKSDTMNYMYSISKDCHLIDIVIIIAVSNDFIVISRLHGQNIGLSTTV
jgi:hypothetical protein